MAAVWRYVSHRNIAPFLALPGMNCATDLKGGEILMMYLLKRPPANRLKLVSATSSMLEDPTDSLDGSLSVDGVGTRPHLLTRGRHCHRHYSNRTSNTTMLLVMP